MTVPPDPGHPDVANRSVGELIGDVSKDLSTLLRQELALARAEMKDELAKAGRGGGMLAGAGLAGWMTLLFLSIAVWAGLANVMDSGWSALIVAAVWAAVGGVLYVSGRRKLRSVSPKPEQTAATLKDVPDALKGH